MALGGLVLTASLRQVNPEWTPGASGREQVACVKEKRRALAKPWPGTCSQPPSLNSIQFPQFPALPQPPPLSSWFLSQIKAQGLGHPQRSCCSGSVLGSLWVNSGWRLAPGGTQSTLLQPVCTPWGTSTSPPPPPPHYYFTKPDLQASGRNEKCLLRRKEADSCSRDQLMLLLSWGLATHLCGPDKQLQYPQVPDSLEGGTCWRRDLASRSTANWQRGRAARPPEARPQSLLLR